LSIRVVELENSSGGVFAALFPFFCEQAFCVWSACDDDDDNSTYSWCRRCLKRIRAESGKTRFPAFFFRFFRVFLLFLLLI